MSVTFRVEATDGAARSGVVTTPRGSFRTPCFMPVGTRGAVRALSMADLEDLGAEVLLGNAYHLMLRPGLDVVADLGGLHGFTGWPGHLLTDSGGYQVFSLEPRVDDDGVAFRSSYDGTPHHLSPEGAVHAQHRLGADIQMVLDVCPPLPSPPEVVRLAVERTSAWGWRARWSFDVVQRDSTDGRAQSLFGIVQGGVDPSLRAESALRTVEIGFDGYGIGGLSVGESRAEMLPALEAAATGLPPSAPRYLMGVGDPVGLIEAIALGVDMFDSVLPTRLARHGTVLTSEGRLRVRNARFATDPLPLDPDCGCPVCRRWSRAYLRHLLSVGEVGASRLLTVHNLAWTLGLVGRARLAVVEGRLGALLAEVRDRWGA